MRWMERKVYVGNDVVFYFSCPCLKCMRFAPVLSSDPLINLKEDGTAAKQRTGPRCP